ncbi:MAG: excalibur calcium-binding domain-containing protein [Massilia sp.]
MLPLGTIWQCGTGQPVRWLYYIIMKKLLFLILLIAGAMAWQTHTKQTAREAALNVRAEPEVHTETADAAPRLPLSAPAAETSFSCDGRKYCSQMRSCAEATYFLRNCPDTKMDGDHDGIPCEQQYCSASYAG